MHLVFGPVGARVLLAQIPGSGLEPESACFPSSMGFRWVLSTSGERVGWPLGAEGMTGH